MTLDPRPRVAIQSPKFPASTLSDDGQFESENRLSLLYSLEAPITDRHTDKHESVDYCYGGVKKLFFEGSMING